jgi:hypothetical protein
MNPKFAMRFFLFFKPDINLKLSGIKSNYICLLSRPVLNMIWDLLKGGTIKSGNRRVRQGSSNSPVSAFSISAFQQIPHNIDYNQ